MGLQPKNAVVLDKIEAAIRKAQQNLFAERALNNETVVISINGVAQNVPARELLDVNKQSVQPKR